MSGDAPRAKFIFQRPTHVLKVRKVRPPRLCLNKGAAQLGRLRRGCSPSVAELDALQPAAWTEQQLGVRAAPGLVTSSTGFGCNSFCGTTAHTTPVLLACCC